MADMSNIKCIVCVGNEAKLCYDCKKYMCNSCIDSEKSISFVLKKHNKCIECEEEICCYKLICHNCDKNPYHMISDNIGVGSCDSDYKDFDVIINLNYPENNVAENDTRVQKQNNKLIIYLGLLDNEYKGKEFKRYLSDIIPLLYKYYRDKRILFHCFSGVSRSAAFAIAYLFCTQNISFEEAFEITKSKRKFINPNKEFLSVLKEFERDFII